MTDDEKMALAVKYCRDLAAEAETPEKERLELYAEMLPVLLKWETGLRGKGLSTLDYVTAIIGCCVTLASHAIRNSCNDEPDKMNIIGPQVTQLFAANLQNEVFNGETAAVIEGRQN